MSCGRSEAAYASAVLGLSLRGLTHVQIFTGDHVWTKDLGQSLLYNSQPLDKRSWAIFTLQLPTTVQKILGNLYFTTPSNWTKDLGQSLLYNSQPLDKRSWAIFTLQLPAIGQKILGNLYFTTPNHWTKDLGQPFL